VNGLPTDQFDKHLLSYLPETTLRSDLSEDSVTYHQLDRSSKLDLATARKIGEIIDEQAIEVVHCTLLNALLYGLLGVAYATRSPALVCAVHTTKAANIKIALADMLVHRHLLKRCEQVWFMCQNQAERWLRKARFLEGSNQVIHNGVKIDFFDPELFVRAGQELRGQLGIPGNARVICSVAGFRPEKLHYVLLQAFEKVTKELPADCYLLLAGAGPMKSKLEEQVRGLGLGERVFFLGEVPDVRPLLAASDCKVLASTAETFSMAMLEAMAMQVPVVSTRVGGAGEAIDDGRSGALITPGDVTDLTNVLLRLLRDDSKLVEMGRQARATIVNDFSYSKMIERSAEKLLEIGVAA